MAKDPKPQSAAATNAEERPDSGSAQPGEKRGGRRAQKPARRTPDQWAHELGEVIPRRITVAVGGQSPDLRSARHRAAAVAHGWDRRVREGFPEIVLTEDDYRAALRAAEKTDARGRGLVHGAALCERERERRAERAEKARAAGKGA